jgi:hypothetical protein
VQKKHREFPQFALLACVVLITVSHRASADVNATFVPTGMQITPTAAKGSTFQGLNPGLSNYPNFLAGQAVATAMSPDGKTLLVFDQRIQPQ